MDIHKPKLAHNWREFLSEIGVIVIGVLIALSAEQTVEALHWRHQLELEREAMRSSLGEQVQVVLSRQAQQLCVEHRLADLQLAFGRHKRGEALQLQGSVGRPQNQTAGTSAWDVAVESQAMAHMARAERDDWESLFGNFRNLERLSVEADKAWVDLSVLDQSEVLDEGDWVALREAYARASAIEGRIRSILPYVLDKVVPESSRELGIRIPMQKVTL